MRFLILPDKSVQPLTLKEVFDQCNLTPAVLLPKIQKILPGNWVSLEEGTLICVAGSGGWSGEGGGLIDKDKSLEELESEHAEILAQKTFVEQEIRTIKSQLEDAKTKRLTTGQYTDRNWWARANKALSLKQASIQALMGRISTLKAMIKKLRTEASQKDWPLRDTLLRMALSVKQLLDKGELTPELEMQLLKDIKEVNAMHPTWVEKTQAKVNGDSPEQGEVK